MEVLFKVPSLLYFICHRCVLVQVLRSEDSSLEWAPFFHYVGPRDKLRMLDCIQAYSVSKPSFSHTSTLLSHFSKFNSLSSLSLFLFLLLTPPLINYGK